MKYVIFEDSLSGHCCFGYSIVDTTEGNNVDQLLHKGLNICETFDVEDAIKICKALNFVDSGNADYKVFYDFEWIPDEHSGFGSKLWKERNTTDLLEGENNAV